MRVTVLSWWFVGGVAGCSMPWASLPEDQAATPVARALAVTDVAPGEGFVATVGSVPVGGQGFLFVSTRGPGAGPCAPGGAACLDIRSPYAVGTATAAGGALRFEATLPPNVPPGTTLWFQAGLRRGTAFATTDVVQRVVVSPNRAPEIAQVVLAPETGGTRCVVTASDPDGDALAISYAWSRVGLASGSDGVLAETGPVLPDGAVPAGDGVSCEVTVSDGRAEVRGGAGPLVPGNRPPILGRVQGHVSGPISRTRVGGLTCTAQDYFDPDGDPMASLTIRWAVDGVEQLSQTFFGRLANNASLAVAGRFTASVGQTVTCTATPNDGQVDGTSASTSWPVVNMPVAWSSVTAPATLGTGDTLVATLSGLTDLDRDHTGTTCRFTYAHPDGPFAPGVAPIAEVVIPAGATSCALPAPLPADSRIVVTAVASDTTSWPDLAPSAVVDVAITSAAPSWPSAGAVLTPAGTLTIGQGTWANCTWTQDATTSRVAAVAYTPVFHLLLSDGTSVPLSPTARAPFGAAALDVDHAVDELIASSPIGGDELDGASLWCEVVATDGVASTSAAVSATTLLDFPDGGLVSLTASPSEQVERGAAFTCTALIHSPPPGGVVEVAVQGSADGATWDDVAVQTSGSTMIVAGAAAGLRPSDRFHRCTATRWVGTGPGQALGATAATPVLDLPPAAVAVVPAVGTPCSAWSCRVQTRPDTQWIDVQLRVEGVIRASGFRLGFGDLGFVPGDLVEALDIPQVLYLNGSLLQEGQEVSCLATLSTGQTLTSTTTVVGPLPGFQPTVTPSDAFVDDELTCGLAPLGCVMPQVDLLPPDAFGANLSWQVNGADVGVDTPTFDTSGLASGTEVQCRADASLDVFVGAPVLGATATSEPVVLRSTRWSVTGADPEGWAGSGLDLLDDVDGDGVSELVVGVPNATIDGMLQAGRVCIVRGDPAGGATGLVDAMVDVGGTCWHGVGPTGACPDGRGCDPAGEGPAGNPDGARPRPRGDGLGVAVRAGDVDGDGVADLVVSAPHAANQRGTIYVLPGHVPGRPDLLSVDGGAITDPTFGAITLHGPTGGEATGWALSLEDVDGDGTLDILAGAPTWQGGSVHVVSVVGVAPGSVLSLDDLADPSTAPFGWTVTGETDAFVPDVNHHRGGHLAPLGDVNDDGFDDVMFANFGNVLDQFLVWGTDRGSDAVASLDRDPVTGAVTGASTLGARGTWLPWDAVSSNPAASSFWGIGAAVVGGRNTVFSRWSGAGDVNGDGIDDLVVPYLESDGNSQLELAVFAGGAALDLGDGSGADPASALFVVEGRTAEALALPTMTSWPVGDVNGDGLDDVAFLLYPLDGASAEFVAELYVVFGKADGAKVTTAALRAGNGGVRLRESAAGVRRLAVGDLDGDGLNDLVWNVVGDPADGYVGRVEAWFGRDLSRDTVTQEGTAGADLMVGTSAPDVWVAGRGDDTLHGFGGADVLYGGAGDDSLRIADDTFVRVDGGRGRDTLVVDMPALDLAAARGRVRSIEVLDLGVADVDLVLDEIAARRLTEGTQHLEILGGAGDRLTLLGNGWDAVDADTLQAGRLTLDVPQDVDVTAAPHVVTRTLDIAEDASVGTVVGVVEVRDLDADVVSVSADLSETGGALAFDPATRVLSVAAPLDHETVPELLLFVTATDATGLATTAWVRVDVTDVNEPPSFATGNATIVLPEYPAATTVYTFSATDPDVGDELTYTLTYGGPEDAFDLDPVTGDLVPTRGWRLDYERQPVRFLNVTVTDLGGLVDTFTLAVSLSDVSTLSLSRSVEFTSQDPSILDNYPNPLDFLAPAALDLTEDLDSDPGASFTFSDPLATIPPLEILPQSQGTVRTTLDVTMEDGAFDLGLPLTVDLSFPDNVVPGTTVPLTGSFAVGSGGWLQALTPGLQVDFGFEATGVLGGIASSLVSDSSTLFNSPGVVHFDFSVPPVGITGQPLSTAFPTGADTTGGAACLASCARVSACYQDVVDAGWMGTMELPACASGGHLDPECWEALDLLGDPTTLPACGASHATDVDLCQESVVSCLDDRLGFLFSDVNLFAAAVPAAAGQAAYTNPRMLLSDPVDVQVLHQELVLEDVMTRLSGTTVGIWWGEITMPLASLGYTRFRYDLWSAFWYYDLGVYAQYVVEVTDVEADLRLEDGTVETVSLGSGSASLPVPLGADVNGDGRVDVEVTWHPQVQVTQVWLWNQQLEWQSALFQMRADVWLYDPTEPLGQSYVGSSGYGPLRESTTVIPFPDLQIDRWLAQGTVSGTSELGLQVAP